MHLGRRCEELGVSRSQLRRWRQDFAARREANPSPVQLPAETLEQQNRRLKQALAEKLLEVDFLEGALQQVEARRQGNIESGARASTPRSGD